MRLVIHLAVAPVLASVADLNMCEREASHQRSSGTSLLLQRADRLAAALANPSASPLPQIPWRAGTQRIVTSLSQATARVRCGTMTGSRRHAGTVLGGRRRGKRPRSPEDEGRWTTGDGVAGGHGRRRTRDDGRRATAWQAATAAGGRETTETRLSGRRHV